MPACAASWDRGRCAIGGIRRLKFDGTGDQPALRGGRAGAGRDARRRRDGENVTQNIRTIGQIPLRLLGEAPPLIEIRGEVYMRRDDFERASTNASAERGGKTFINPRNAAGAVRQLDNRGIGRQKLSFFAYGLGDAQVGAAGHAQRDAGCDRRGFGLPVNRERARWWQARRGWWPSTSDIAAMRDALPFDIDGVVYKVNEVALQKRLGLSRASPAGRWRTSIRRRSR